MWYVRAMLASVSSRGQLWLRMAAVVAVVVVMLASAIVAGSAFAGAPAAAHSTLAVQRMLADGPNSICPPSTWPCP